jgi:hypothetical protein
MGWTKSSVSGLERRARRTSTTVTSALASMMASAIVMRVAKSGSPLWIDATVRRPVSASVTAAVVGGSTTDHPRNRTARSAHHRAPEIARPVQATAGVRNRCINASRAGCDPALATSSRFVDSAATDIQVPQPPSVASTPRVPAMRSILAARSIRRGRRKLTRFAEASTTLRMEMMKPNGTNSVRFDPACSIATIAPTASRKHAPAPSTATPEEAG